MSDNSMTTTGQDGKQAASIPAAVQLAISAYRNLGQAQREVERRKAELDRRVGRMTPEEFKASATATMAVDARGDQ